MAGTQMNTNFMDQFYTTQRSPGSQDGFAWAPRGGGQTGAYGAPTPAYGQQSQQYGGYPQQQQYVAYQQQQQYGGYPQQQQWPPQQGWGQQGPMGYPPQGPVGYAGGPIGGGYPGRDRAYPGMPRPAMGGYPGQPGRPVQGPPGGLDFGSILAALGGGDDPFGGSPFAPPQGNGNIGQVVNRLAGLVNQITDVINQLGTVVETLVNKNQTAVAVLPPAMPPDKPPVAPAPAKPPEKLDPAVEALFAALGLGTTPPPTDNTAANTNDADNVALINELLGAFA